MSSTAIALHRNHHLITIDRFHRLAAIISTIVLGGLALTQANAQITVDGKTAGQTIRGYANRAAYTGRPSSRSATHFSSARTIRTSANTHAIPVQDAAQTGGVVIAQPAVYTVPRAASSTITSTLPATTTTQSGATFAVDRYSRQRRPAHHNNRKQYNYRGSYYSYGYPSVSYYYGYTPYYSHRSSYGSYGSYGYGYGHSSRYGYSYSPYSSHSSYGYGSSGHHYSGYSSHYGGYGHGGRYGGYGRGYSGYSGSYGSCR